MSKLKIEIDTPAMGDRIREAFVAWAGDRNVVFESFFEHGQWWIRAEANPDLTYSVVDATGGDSVDGFSFEKV
jgi:hypothetical protein